MAYHTLPEIGTAVVLFPLPLQSLYESLINLHIGTVLTSYPTSHASKRLLSRTFTAFSGQANDAPH